MNSRSREQGTQIQHGASDDGLHKVSIALAKRVYAKKRGREYILLVPERRNQLSCLFFRSFNFVWGPFAARTILEIWLSNLH
jgi:hypothetical protein